MRIGPLAVYSDRFSHYKQRCSLHCQMLLSPLLLTWLLPVSFTAASLIVPSTNITHQDRAAAFGPLIGHTGLAGILIPIDILDSTSSAAGCHPLSLDALNHLGAILDSSDPVRNRTLPPSIHWFAMVQRGECSFTQKIRSMQSSGASAVIVGDNSLFGDLITMYGQGNVSDIVVPSSFISTSAYQELRMLAYAVCKGSCKSHSNVSRVENTSLNDISDSSRRTPIHPIAISRQSLNSIVPDGPAEERIRRLETVSAFYSYDAIHDLCSQAHIPCLYVLLMPLDPVFPVIDVIIVTVMSLIAPIVVMLCIYYVWLFLQFHFRRKPTVSRDDLLQVPTKVFATSRQNENDPTICAICLTDFQDDETLRKFAVCHHEFHIEFGYVPICKREIIPIESTPLLESTRETTQMSGARLSATTTQHISGAADIV
ncbi:hypothetical protein BASA62_006586 [Batrachochytrium salamandrivorans]|nr:hypothetical protein BASA62_006586 [Batrachochytrium salamandrivorans]